ncbi:SDR family oxidoreductase [Loigolactobacillus backii]|uniref:Short-chain dehydrogenase/reductase n=1 Tax=Loigolactobacillus backii TaxID=375175 RepID=A0A192H418_9LACO|nr:SDR family oxidoreductase [Loigolactobacillus backii]ANK62962.1 short-chain dehydrogenase/reductase [Loigolactobacillus backii]ANK70030.1 short-chain dehydrogenase/reductase [Loigolactobacillus backii]MDA5387010.1 SDR family oxidoreductase [Loigolactobacillus backii]MDA5389548.1 SDR family oxidoreductase [Loigolactobacillus backii]PIO83387.1 short-chain dehydrogenase/reductase [Loigolactobacillus backii]
MKTWFITGATGGLASQVVKRLLERGDQVAATVRKMGALDQIQKNYGRHLRQYQLDLTNPDQISEVVRQAFNDFGSIDVILNNAAYGLYGAVEEVSDEQIQRLFQVNVFGSLRVARAVMPFLRHQHDGQIVQIASMAGEYSEPAMGLYSASKWAIEGAFEALSKEVEPFGVKVLIVEPGGIRTNFAGKKASVGKAMDAYQDTQVGKFMNRLTGQVSAVDAEQMKRLIVGDPGKMAEQIIHRVDRGAGPLRIALGSDAYTKIRKSLEQRLSDLDAQKKISYLTDADDTKIK